MSSCSYLCWLVPEPLWTKNEKERFWGILEAYLRRLVNDEMPLPSITLDHYKKQKQGKGNTYDLYKNVIREYMWCGRYSLAVSMFKTLNRSCKPDPNKELMAMKKIFMEKPFRGYGHKIYGNCR